MSFNTSGASEPILPLHHSKSGTTLNVHMTWRILIPKFFEYTLEKRIVQNKTQFCLNGVWHQKHIGIRNRLYVRGMFLAWRGTVGGFILIIINNDDNVLVYILAQGQLLFRFFFSVLLTLYFTQVKVLWSVGVDLGRSCF